MMGIGIPSLFKINCILVRVQLSASRVCNSMVRVPVLYAVSCRFDSYHTYKWAVGVNGNISLLHGEARGSTPLLSIT